MAGVGGQFTFVVPSLDPFIVRMGHLRENTPAMREELNEALGGIVASTGED